MVLLALPTAVFRVAQVSGNSGYLVADRIGEPMDLDPAWAYDTSSAEMLMNIFDPLLFFNRTNMDSYTPRLATSWTITPINEVSPEGLVWKSRVNFVLRTGVHFQDTTPPSGIPGAGALLTTQDVEYTFERLLVTDAATGPSWMVWEPLLSPGGAAGLDQMLTDLGWPVNATTGWNTKMDEAIDHAIESDATTVWFNLVMLYEPILQILSESLGSIVNQAWCVWHNDWPGMQVGDDWYLWHDPAVSPWLNTDPHSPRPHLDCALGTGPYMLDYWNKGAGNAWSIIKNPNYWEGWSVPFRHEGWGSGEPAINGHVDRYTSNYIPDWNTRKQSFLSGTSDFCDVPRSNMDEVLDQPGIECIYPLLQLGADACFFNFAVNESSTHMGVMQDPGVFNRTGAPPDIMEDQDFRRAMTHMFNYTKYLETAFVNEAISPVTPIIPGISYHDPSIGRPEDPFIDQRKMYDITGEPAGQLAYDMSLAKTYLQTAWGGQLWANGFTIDAVSIIGSAPKPNAAMLIKDAFDTMNALYGTEFTINVVYLTWNEYHLEWRQRTLPYFIVGWLADYPDAHNFAQPFMHSAGAFSKYQGFKGVTSFPNQVVDDHIDAGIATTVRAERQGNYTWLQQYYVDNAPGFCTAQATGRHFQRDWVEGWHYSAFYPGNNIYDLWKHETFQDVDVAVMNFPTVPKLEIGFPPPTNPIIRPKDLIFVTAARLDTNASVPTVQVIIAVGLKSAKGETVLGYQNAMLKPAPMPGSIFVAEFDYFNNSMADTIVPGLYTIFAEVLLVSSYANDTNPANNRIDQAPNGCEGKFFEPDVNVDGTVDMADISLCIDAFMTSPGFPSWDIRCDINSDSTVDMADISLCIDAFMTSFDP